MMTIWQGSRELLAPTITRDGTTVTTGIEFALTAATARPTTWAAPTVVGGKPGYLLDGTETAGSYMLWARVTDNPETPVLQCGTVRIY